MRAVLISYCVVSNAERAIKFPVMLMNNVSISVIPHDRIPSVFLLMLGTCSENTKNLRSETLQGRKQE